MGGSDPYPVIAQILIASAGGPWEKIVLEVELEVGAGRFKAVAHPGQGAPRGIRITDVAALHDLFEDVQRITTEIGGARWKTARFTLHRSGEFETDFDY